MFIKADGVRRMLFVIIVGFVVTLAAGPAEGYNARDQVTHEEVGEVVDVLRLGFRHWSSASGDPTPDIVDNQADVDDSVGDHDCNFTVSPYSVWDPISEDYGESHWPFTLDPGNVMSFTMAVPEAGQYVVAFQGLYNTAGTYSFEFQKGASWLLISDFGPSLGDQYQTITYCFIVETEPGQTTIPMKISGTGYKLGLSGFIVAKLAEDAFASSATSGFTHNRAMFDANEAAQISARTTGNSFLNGRFATVKSNCNAASKLSSGYFDSLDGGKITGSSGFCGKLIGNALLSQVDGDMTRRGQAIQLLMKATQDWSPWNAVGRLHHGGLLRAVSVGYEHLYDDLTPVQRDIVRRRLDKEARYLYVDSITQNWWSPDTRANNWQAVAHSGLAMAGLVLKDESIYANQYHDWGKYQCKVYIDTSLTASGACRESYGYYDYGLGSIAPYMVMLRNVTGEDMFDYDSGVVQKTVPYSAYLMTALRDGFFTFDDMDFGYSHTPITPVAAVATYKQDPVAQWLVKYYTGEYSGRSNWPGWRLSSQVYAQLWYDPSIATESPDVSARTPLGATFSEDGLVGAARWGSGHVMMRTGWESTDDIVYTLQCGDSGGYHGHADQGSFQLDAYGGHLVGHEGKKGSYSGAGNAWTHSSNGNSVVLIDGEGQVNDHKFGNGRMTRDGTIDDFHHDANIGDYALANSKIAYDEGPHPVDHSLRHVMFVRKPGRQGYFVIADDIQSATAGSHAYSWLLHSDGGVTVTTDQAGASFRFSRSQSAMDVMFATPQSVAMQKITSEAGTSFPAYVKTTASSDRGVFVAMLYPESSRLGIYTPTVTRIEVGDLAGFELNDDLVLFSKSAGLWIYGDVQSDAQMIYIDRSTPGDVSYLVAGATILRVQGVEVFSSALATTASGTYVGLPFDGDPPTITAWYSAGDHGRGVGEVLLEIADDGSFSESRDGISKLIVEFSEPVDPLSVASAFVALGGRDANNERMDMNSISVAVTVRDATTAEITFTPALADYARYYVSISGVTDLAANAQAGDKDRIVAALAGDASGDLRVNVSDMSVVRGARTKLIDPNSIDEVRSDLTVDGRVNVADLSRMRPQLGNDATGIDDPEPDPNFYQLTVNSGDGDGSVAAGDVVNISADTVGRLFDVWTGDVSYLADANDPNTTVTMPESPVTVTATYRDVLPAPWQNMDIGPVGIAGSASVADGNWTLRASGLDIWNSSDQFHYVYQPCSGDVEIIARVSSVQYTHDWAKYGVMIRESLDADSTNAFVGITPMKTTFQRRTVTGSTTTSTTITGDTAPRWVKLTRVGNTFTGYNSTDGVNWTTINSDTVSMSSDVYIGLAALSHNDSVLGTGTMQNVSVSP